MYLVDYHTHSKYSMDSQAKPEDVCRAAVQKGLQEIAVTDHFDPTAADEDCRKNYDADAVQAEIMRMKEQWQGKLKVLYGLELGQAHKYQPAAERILTRPFDYVIGSMHNIEGDIDLALVRYSGFNYDVFEQYYRELLALSREAYYDCLGHIDYPKRYAAVQKFPYTERRYMDYIRQILKNVIEGGRGIELNTSGLRQQVGTTMPSKSILKLYRDLGGEIITTGSDAHVPHAVGQNMADAQELLRTLGFRYITTFEARKPTMVKL